MARTRVFEAVLLLKFGVSPVSDFEPSTPTPAQIIPLEEVMDRLAVQGYLAHKKTPTP